VDLDVPFGLIFAVGATATSYSNLAVIAAITWQVLFISVPMLFIAFSLQVLHRFFDLFIFRFGIYI